MYSRLLSPLPHVIKRTLPTFEPKTRRNQSKPIFIRSTTPLKLSTLRTRLKPSSVNPTANPSLPTQPAEQSPGKFKSSRLFHYKLKLSIERKPLLRGRFKRLNRPSPPLRSISPALNTEQAVIYERRRSKSRDLTLNSSKLPVNNARVGSLQRSFGASPTRLLVYSNICS